MTEHNDPELAVHADDCHQQDMDTIRELARLGLSFHFQTTMFHFMLSCGRDDTPGFESLQRERMALSARITELQESLPDDVKADLRMERLTPEANPAPKVMPYIRLTLDKDEI